MVHPVPPTCPGIHPSALVHPDAQVGASAEIGPYAAVESRAKIGPDCRIGSFVSIGAASAKAARSVHRPALFAMFLLAPCGKTGITPGECSGWLSAGADKVGERRNDGLTGHSKSTAEVIPERDGQLCTGLG
jgi:hypothetical protein